MNVHRNEPGVLSEINGLISQAGANIEGQYLSTDASIGYLVMDVDSTHAATLCDSISQLERSIRTRLIRGKVS